MQAVIKIYHKKLVGAIFTIGFAISIFLTPSHLTATTPKIEILTGGYQFSSSYSLQRRSSEVHCSDLVVNVVAGRPTGYVRNDSGFIVSGFFIARLSFTLNNKQGILRTSLPVGRPIRKKHIKSSSKWYPGLKTLLDRVVACRDKWKRKENYKSEVNTRRSRSSRVRIKQLPGSQLKTIYSLRTRRNLLSKGPLLWCVWPVHVVTAFEIIDGYGGRPVLTATVSFPRQNDAAILDTSWVIKFVKTKNGFREVVRRNIEHSSVWYPSLKKVAKNSVKLFQRFKHI